MALSLSAPQTRGVHAGLAGIAFVGILVAAIVVLAEARDAAVWLWACLVVVVLALVAEVVLFVLDRKAAPQRKDEHEFEI